MSNFLRKEPGAQDSALWLALQEEGELRFPRIQKFQTLKATIFVPQGGLTAGIALVLLAVVSLVPLIRVTHRHLLHGRVRLLHPDFH